MTTVNLAEQQILIADDDIESAGLLAEQLAGLGAKVVQVNTALDTFDALAKEPFSYAFFHINLPEIQFFAFMEKMKLAAGKTKFVALTSRYSAELARIIRDIGCELLAKPVDSEELNSLLEKMSGEEALLEEKPVIPKLLIVDDEEIILGACENILIDMAEVETCNCPVKALDILKKKTFDILLTDINMPLLDGITLIKVVKKIQPEIIPIIITGLPDLRTSISANKAGATDYLAKPIEPIVLEMTVQRAIDRLKFQRQRQDLFNTVQSALLDVEEKKNEIQATNIKLQNTQAQLVQSAKLASIGTLASGIAHELNNPLAALIGSIGLVNKFGEDNPKLTPHTERVKKIAERMKGIVRRLMEYAEETKVDSSSPVSINESIENALLFFNSQFEEMEIEVDNQLSDDIPMLKADQAQLETVIQSLLANSRDAYEKQSSESEKKIVIITKEDSEGGIMVIYDDNAGGIGEDIQDQIFDPFFTTAQANRSGLGLSTSHQIMQKHGGDIWLESSDDDGSCFVVTFPPSIVISKS